MFAALVWQTAQNGRLHKTWGTDYQSFMYPTNYSKQVFLMPFLLLLPVSGNLSYGFFVPPTKACILSATPACTYWVPWISESILNTLDWLWKRLQPTKACFKRSRWFGKRHKTDAFTIWGEPTIRAASTPRTVPDRHFWGNFCFFLTASVRLRHGLTVPPTKACLLCATPAGTYRVQSPGFPKIVCCYKRWKTVRLTITLPVPSTF